MNIEILGCHGSEGFLEGAHGPHPCNTCGFLLNGTLLIDAGTVATALSPASQKQIRHIVLSHLHFDHIKGLPALADNLSEHAKTPIVVAAIPEVIRGLQLHVFNSNVYPDFFAIPTSQNPVLAAQHLKPDNSYSFSGIDITPILVNHTVPTCGFIIRDGEAGLVYSGDTSATNDLWQEARRIPHLKAAFIECSYPNSMNDLARTSKHLTPALFAEEYKKLGRTDVAVYAYHLKPDHRAQIEHELSELHIPTLSILEEGQTLTI